LIDTTLAGQPLQLEAAAQSGKPGKRYWPAISSPEQTDGSVSSTFPLSSCNMLKIFLSIIQYIGLHPGGVY
jgi:hypothetical protein